MRTLRIKHTATIHVRKLAKCFDGQWRGRIVTHYVIDIYDNGLSLLNRPTQFVTKDLFG
jgi:hypothetical protein